jgi:hypothetical protein
MAPSKFVRPPIRHQLCRLALGISQRVVENRSDQPPFDAELIADLRRPISEFEDNNSPSISRRQLR